MVNEQDKTQQQADTTVTFTTTELVDKRKALLDTYKRKQNFSVAFGWGTKVVVAEGKVVDAEGEVGKWKPYTTFNSHDNLREILKDEVVIEFDTNDRNKSWLATSETGINLRNANIIFEVWEHGGRSPHIHIHNLPISDLVYEERKVFKDKFIRRYVPRQYIDCVDFSLTARHLVAVEWQRHWKGCYGVKRLVNVFRPEVR